MQWKRIKVGVLTFCLVLLLAFMFSKSGRFYEVFYLKFLFQFIRVIHDYTFGVLPVPSIYIVVPAFFYYFLGGTFRKGVKSVFNGLLLAVIWIINWFYILWGFNYAQGSGYELFDLEPVKVDSTYIESEFLAQTDIINHTVTTKDIFPFQSNEAEIRPLMKAFISEKGFPTHGRVRIRKIPGGGLLHFRTSGIYIPHAFEGHVDGGLFKLQYPFTIAHEMAHGYSFTDESVCNYIAYKVCTSSDNPWIRYSAELAYWRYLSGY
ncbi:MAG: DUF3810 family protein, partial [Saprospiraceae bacterium]|nr:DUF3810 family protein [Saprospiraceae bacterium]